MGFADEVAAVAAKPKGPRCTAGQAAEKLDPADRDGFEACLQAVRDGTPMGGRVLTYAQVVEVLAARGLEVAEHTLSRHARHKCKCSPWEAAAA